MRVVDEVVRGSGFGCAIRQSVAREAISAWTSLAVWPLSDRGKLPRRASRAACGSSCFDRLRWTVMSVCRCERTQHPASGFVPYLDDRACAGRVSFRSYNDRQIAASRPFDLWCLLVGLENCASESDNGIVGVEVMTLRSGTRPGRAS